MVYFFDLPHGVAAMVGEAIESANFGQGSQFVFVERNAELEIFDRREGLALAFFEEFDGVIRLEALNHAEAEADGVEACRFRNPVRGGHVYRRNPVARLLPNFLAIS